MSANANQVEPLNPANPFPGLRSFTTAESALFFGCEPQRQALLRMLKRNRFLAVLGASGSGKSSLIRAGLIPTLRRGFRTRAGSHWRVAIMTPGANPIARLAIATSAVLGAPGVDDQALQTTMLETTLRRSGLGLVEAVRQSQCSDNVLILVDQFEELFRIRPDPRRPALENPAAAFVRLLLEALRQDELPIYIIITMRSDFLEDCAKYQGLPEAINRGTYLIPRLSREQRREVITGPIELRGARLAPRLLHRLLNDVGDSPDQLPILQHALMRTWDYWVTHHSPPEPLDLPHYEAIGTMSAALERHADEAFAELDVLGQQIAEKLFKRLTEKGTDNRQIRHPATLRDVCAVTAADPTTVGVVLDKFRRQGRSFILPGAERPPHPDLLLDISHESLIRVWRRLTAWVDEEAWSAYEYRRLVERAQLYRAGKDTYLRDPALGIALDWRERAQPNAAWAARYHPAFAEAMAFLDESLAKNQQEQAAQEAARRRELEQAQALAAEQGRRFREQRKAARWLGGLAILLGLVLLAAAGTALYAWEQRALAEHEQRLAWARELANATTNNLPIDPQRSLLLALYAVKATREQDGFVTTAAHHALNRAVQAVRAQPLQLAGHQDSVTAVAFRGARQALSTGADGAVTLWDTAMQRPSANLTTDQPPLTALAVAPAGQRFAAADASGTVLLWADSALPPQSLPAHAGAVTALAFSPDGTRLASSGHDGQIQLWDAASGQVRQTLTGHRGPVAALTFAPSGTPLASAGWDTTVRLWQPATGALLHTLEGHREAVTALAFSPAGTHLASAGWDATVRLWNPVAGTLTHALTGHSNAVVALAFNPVETQLASAGWDGLVKLWQPVTGQLQRNLEGHRGAVTVLAFAANGTRLASAGWDRQIRLWQPAAGQIRQILQGHTDWINALAFSADGSRLLSGSDDRRILLWRVAGDRLTQLPGYLGWEAVQTLSRDGNRLATVVAGQVQILDTRSGDILYTIPRSDGVVRQMAFSQDGGRIATVGDSPTTVREYYLAIDDLLIVARRLRTRELTSEECHDFLHRDKCPPLPAAEHQTHASAP